MRNLAAAICGVLAVSAVVAPPAYAGWLDDDIKKIIGDIKDVKDQVTGTGPIKRVADDFKK